MKILASSDLHGDARQAEKLAQRAQEENVDLVILCGDIVREDQSSGNMLKPFKQHNQKVLLIPGNHDQFATADFLAEVYDVKNIHGYSVRYEDLGIFGCGGTNIGLEQLSEDEILNYLKKGFDRIKYLKKKIMVTHVHPSDSIAEKMSKFVPPSFGVRQAISQFKPDILLCGHVHEAAGIEEKIENTRVLNVGKEGKIFDL
jgi:uncharacterized protein